MIQHFKFSLNIKGGKECGFSIFVLVENFLSLLIISVTRRVFFFEKLPPISTVRFRYISVIIEFELYILAVHK
jgi:hypothetical protein